MKWGVRRARKISGEKVYQGKMNSSEREHYAKNRIKKVGARQALDDETDKLNRNMHIGMTALFGGNIGLGSVTMGSLVTGAWPVAIASGAGVVANMLTAGPRMTKQMTNASRNIEAIKREADIPDYTTGNRRNVRA